jgi:hypothetical protein
MKTSEIKTLKEMKSKTFSYIDDIIKVKNLFSYIHSDKKNWLVYQTYQSNNKIRIHEDRC